MKKGLLLAMLALQCAGTMVQASVTCGSREAGFVVSGGTLDVSTNGLSLTNGLIRDTTSGNTGLSGTVTCDSAVIEREGGSVNTSMLVDGSYVGGGAITLTTDNHVLYMNGGTTPSTVKVNSGSGSTVTGFIKGHGDFGGDITIGSASATNASHATLKMDVSSTVTRDIIFDAGSGAGNTATLELLSDLQLGDDATFDVISSSAAIKTEGNTVRFGGADLVYSNETAGITWSDTSGRSSIELNAKFTLGSSSNEQGWIFSSDAEIVGNDNELALGADGTTVLTASSDLYLTDVNVTGIQASNLSLTGSLFLRNASIKDSSGAGHFKVHGEAEVSASTGDFFGATVTWASAPTIELLDTMTFGASGLWTLPSGTILIGNGNVIDMQGCASGKGFDFNGDVYASGVTFAGLQATSGFADAGVMYLSDVTLSDTMASAIRISGDLEGSDQGPAQVTMTDAKTPFTGSVTFNSGATVEMLSTVILEHNVLWNVEDNVTLLGNGNIVDLSTHNGAGFTIAAGKTLKIRDAILLVDSGSTMTFDNASSTLDLANVTIVLKGSNVDWTQATASFGQMAINGPTTIITGQYTFTPPATSSSVNSNNVNNTTLWYDTLEHPDLNNIVEEKWTTSTGRIATVVQSDTNKGDINVSNSFPQIGSSAFLNPNDGNVVGRYLLVDNSTAVVTFNGHGRSLIMGDTSATSGADQQLIKDQVATSSGYNITLKHVMLDGLKYEHFKTPGKFIFGDGAHIRLQEDDTISTSYSVQDGGAASTIIFDLNGKTLDLGAGGFEVLLTHASSNFLIKNGRIKDATGDLLDGNNSSHVGTITLQDVAVELSGDLNLNYGKFVIKGDTTFFVGGDGAVGRSIVFDDGATSFTIAAGATLTLENGVTFDHNKTTANTFLFGDQSATLRLVGANMDLAATADGDDLQTGRLILDHICTFTASSNSNFTYNLGPDLDIHLMPGAQFKIEGYGKIAYANAS